MTENGLPRKVAQDRLLDRILATDKVLVALRCGAPDALAESLRGIAVHTGRALYWWRARSGLCRLSGHDEVVPGVTHLADVLHLVAHNPGSGVYFLADSVPEWSADLLALLRPIAEGDPRQPRRLVLLGTLRDFPLVVAAREVAWGRPPGTGPRLRHGAWVRPG